MLNLAFCDDDKSFLKEIVPAVKREFYKRNINVDCSLFTNGNELIKTFKLRCPHFDIIFLDIEMPVIDGKITAKELRSIDKNFKLIFITAYEKEALNMFQYDVLGFLPKNKLNEYMSDTIERVIQRIEEERPQMQFFQVYDFQKRVAEIKIPLNEIKYLEILQRKIFLHSISENFQLYHYQFNELVNKYYEFGFLDIHRTCIVNPKFLVKVGENSVHLDDGQELLMSRRKRKKVLELLLENVCEGITK